MGMWRETRRGRRGGKRIKDGWRGGRVGEEERGMGG